MTDSHYLASTYLRVLRTDEQLMTTLQGVLGERMQRVMDAEFIYQDDIEVLFEAFAQSGLESWVLRYGDQISVASHGPLGFAVLSAPDLHTALNVLADFSLIRSSTYTSRFQHVDNRIEFVCDDQTDNALVGRWLIESGFRVAQNLIETVMAHPMGDNAVIRFAYPEPPYADALQRFYGIQCEYDAPYNCISIPASWCRITSPLSDPSTFNTNLRKCQELKLTMQDADDVTASVRLMFARYFDQRIEGKVTINDLPTLQSIAEAHHTSTRTLARRLSTEHESYKSLLDSCRQNRARELLSSTHLSVAEIADRLAYQETANFIRAFKTWFNETPGAWRRSNSASSISQTSTS